MEAEKNIEFSDLVKEHKKQSVDVLNKVDVDSNKTSSQKIDKQEPIKQEVNKQTSIEKPEKKLEKLNSK